MQWYLKAFKNYANFSGRARRKEYWLFQLFNGIIALLLYLPVLSSLPAVMAGEGTTGIASLFMTLYIIYLLAVILPSLAVTVRRLHDTGKSGWSILLGLIPLVGGIIVLVFVCTDSQPGQNSYGENPKVAA
ncbi:Inner membrane protein YhaI [compost metagenome]